MASEERELTPRDIFLLHKRSEMIIRLTEAGMLSPQDFYDLFEGQKKPEVIEEERMAWENPNSSPDDSPYVRLHKRYTRMGGTFKD